MKCLYDVLEVDQHVDDATLKKQYRKLALKWHPDKNANQEEHAREQFQLIQNAWEVLSDPRERAWSETAFSGFCDKDARSFYGVYSRIFEQLDSQEQEAYRRQKPVASKLRQPDVAPPFGDSFANDAAVKATYVHWGNFQTIKDFAWLDEFNPSSAEGRRVRRLMEQENERRRRAGKMAFVAAVRGLAEHVKSIDPRVQLLQRAAEERKAAANKAVEERRKAEREAQQVAAAAYEDADWITAGEEEQLAKLESVEESDAPTQMYECVVCDKLYKSEKALQNHEASKKHKEQMKKFKRMMKEEDGLCVQDLKL